MTNKKFSGAFIRTTIKMIKAIFIAIVLVFSLPGLIGIITGEMSFGEWFGFTLRFILPLALFGSVGFGILFGFLNTFSYKTTEITFPFQDKNDFISRVDAATEKLGLYAESKNQNCLVYKRNTFQLKNLPIVDIMGLKIIVKMKENSAVITTPSLYIKKLREELQI